MGLFPSCIPSGMGGFPEIGVILDRFLFFNVANVVSCTHYWFEVAFSFFIYLMVIFIAR